jgi:CTD small phosphatase-like protein 2
MKDLRIFNRDMKDIVLVDNAAYSFGVNIENGIPIIPYYENKDDKELKHLFDFLVTHVLPAYDCRTVLQETFKLREF